jgi:NADH-quinone oxidoreductase subunit C
MSQKLDTLQAALERVLAERIVSLVRRLGEITITVKAADYLEVAKTLRDHPHLDFVQLTDLCGVDYSGYANVGTDGPRYAAVSHLLSLQHNWRLRLRVFAPDDDFPVVASVCPIWTGANWFEREAFDLVGIVFDGHQDLRRILTDYGFIGHPLRKDFPAIGHVEMRYDEQQRRVIYQPVSIEQRENVPRIVREDNYGGLH